MIESGRSLDDDRQREARQRSREAAQRRATMKTPHEETRESRGATALPPPARRGAKPADEMKLIARHAPLSLACAYADTCVGTYTRACSLSGRQWLVVNLRDRVPALPPSLPPTLLGSCARDGGGRGAEKSARGARERTEGN